jgi:hypothetical protein
MIIESVYLEQIKTNIPLENEVWSLNYSTDTKPDADKSNQWHRLSESQLNILKNVGNKSIDYNQSDGVWSSIHTFLSIAGSVSRMEIGEKMKQAIIIQCFYQAGQLTLDYSNSDPKRNSIIPLPLNSFSLDNILVQSKEYSKFALTTFGSTYIELAKNPNFQIFLIYEISSVGRYCISRSETSTFLKEAVIYILNVLIKISKIIETDDKPEKERHLYFIYEEAKSISTWFKGDKTKFKDYLSIIDKKIESLIKFDLPSKNEQTETDWTLIN